MRPHAFERSARCDALAHVVPRASDDDIKVVTFSRFFNPFSEDLGIDLGTSNTLIYARVAASC